MKRFLVPTERPNECKPVRDLPKHRVMTVKITKLENIVLMHACNFRWAKNITILGWPTQSYCYRTLSGPQCVMKVKNCQIREHCAIACL